MPSISMTLGVSNVFRLMFNLLLGGEPPRRVLAVDRVMLRVTPTLLLAFVIAGGSDLPSDPTQIETAQTLPTVTRVIDGDTDEAATTDLRWNTWTRLPPVQFEWDAATRACPLHLLLLPPEPSLVNLGLRTGSGTHLRG